MDPVPQAVIAATASFVVVSAIIASILFICKPQSKRRRTTPSVSKDRAKNSPLPKLIAAPLAGPSSASTSESASFDPALNRVSIQELIEATRNFSPELIVGDGSFGFVYKARLDSGPIVAVKKLSPDAFQGLREFRAEMETLGKIRHPNIVKILGYCTAGLDRILIYEFIENGSLDQWLYDTSDEDQADVETPIRPPLSWNTRMKILKGVARGLAFMHTLETPIIHRDIKASNILLDADFEAHIADFGLARRVEGSHTHVSTQVAGTMGYMPPEYLQGLPVATVTGDVYSFGVLLLESVTGKRPNLPFRGEDRREIRFMEWISRMEKRKRCVEIVDACICKDDLEENVVMEILRIGIRCAHDKSKARPMMSQVVEELDKVLGVKES